MSGRNTPHDVDRPVRGVALKDQDAGPLGIARVVFDDHGTRQTGNDVTHLYVISRELVVPMRGDLHLAVRHQRE
jgi:hypothetical protein